MTIAVFEDDSNVRTELAQMISRFTHYPPAISTGDKAELLRYVGTATLPTLYFLDIVANRRPEGLELADAIHDAGQEALIVFLTAYPHLLIGNHGSLTISFTSIDKNRRRVRTEVEQVIALAGKVFDHECLTLRNAGETLHIPYKDITYIEIPEKGLERICIHGSRFRYTININLSEIHKKLDGRFVRCHRSCIANREQVMEIRKKGRELVFRDGSRCPYTTRYIKDL